MTRMIWLGMDLRRDRFEHEHDSVAANEGEEVRSNSVSSSFIANVEPQLGLIESKRGIQVIDNKKGSNTVQHSKAPKESEYSLVEEFGQLSDCPAKTHEPI